MTDTASGDDVPPCTLEDYTRVHAAMSYRGDATAARVLANLGIDAASWLACQVYWSPRVASNVDPKFDIAAAIRFRELMKIEIQKLR